MLVFLLMLPAAAANAQEASAEPRDQGPVFLANYNFHISAEAVSKADPRFSWIGRVGGDFDVVDLGWAGSTSSPITK